MADFYKSITKSGESLYTEKGSKFLGFAMAIQNEQELKDQIDILRKEHHKARHVCWGMITGEIGDVKKSNDDGEPNYSAGEPILGQLVTAGITFSAVFVVRYFGGTKLGVGGLKQAYKQAALEAIANSTIKKIYPSFKLKISFPYDQTQVIMKLADQYGTIINQEYSDITIAIIIFKEMNRNEVVSQLHEIAFKNIRFKEISE